MQYRVTTICGSMRFREQMLALAGELTGSGFIVLMPFSVKGEGADPDMLDDMHRRKIDMSDSIYVVTGGTGYVGTSTRGEIEYAGYHGKSISWDELS